MRIVLSIGGERIPLYFGMVAFEEMQKLVSSYMGTNKYACDVAWAGYLNQCAIDSLYPEMTYGDLMVKLEDHFFDVEKSDSNINEVLKVFEESKAGSKLFNVVDQALDILKNVGDDLKGEESKKKTKKIPKTRRLPTKR
ncbi:MULTISPECIES: hypothetical protein [unclassified Sphingobacterium]|uniref:hypothetical protein n=1 Tax=unclassified Sphingobacterium TaxID=2609468 RepID=UPI0020C4EBB3|nr:MULTISPECIES: hypothetical protein [unclassified Sphingobacterium]